jgi:hypothetical protein
VHKREDISPYGGLSACEPDLGDSLLHEDGGEEVYFWGCEEMLWWRLWDSFFWHAVQAPQIAFFCYGDSEVVVLTLEGIREEGGEGFGVLDCFSSSGTRLDWREAVMRVFLDCWCCRSNSSCSLVN